MPILFLATLLLVGPAWCSHLCYFGAWDGLAARARRRARGLSPHWHRHRFALFVATPATALALRAFGVGAKTAALAAVAFGVCGVTVMAGASTRSGWMVHCTGVCPLGVAANLLGRISPFRLRIETSCTECGRCATACRYGALQPSQIRDRRPGLTCSLCGDCLAACPEKALSYGFLGLRPEAARRFFLVMVVSLHAVFLGVARI